MTSVKEVQRYDTSSPDTKSAPALFAAMEAGMKDKGEEIVKTVKGMVVFKIDGEDWTLDLREGAGELYKGSPKIGKADLTLVLSDENFAKLVMGKLNPQQAFLTRKLQIKGSMGLAMKLQPILEAAKPRSKL